MIESSIQWLKRICHLNVLTGLFPAGGSISHGWCGSSSSFYICDIKVAHCTGDIGKYYSTEISFVGGLIAHSLQAEIINVSLNIGFLDVQKTGSDISV